MLLHQYLEKFAKSTPEFLFSEFSGRDISYEKANKLANKLARALINFGLKKGDRFSFLAKNCDEMAIMYHAASKAGIVPVRHSITVLLIQSGNILLMTQDQNF